MNQPRSRTGPRLFALALVLLIMALVGAACGSVPAPAAPQATQPAASAPTGAAPQATQPAASAPAPASFRQDSQDQGPSLAKSPAAAIARHYQGDPNAPVVLIEVSDFQ